MGFRALFGRRLSWCALWFPPISSRGRGPSIKHVNIYENGVCIQIARCVIQEASKGGLVYEEGRSKNFDGRTLWTAPRKAGRICLLTQSVRQSQIRQLPLFLSLPLCESRNFSSVRARPEKCGISRDLRLCSILHHGKQDGGKWKVIKWNPHSLFSSPYYLYKVSCLASRSIAIFGGRRFSKSGLSYVSLTDRRG